MYLSIPYMYISIYMYIYTYMYDVCVYIYIYIYIYIRGTLAGPSRDPRWLIASSPHRSLRGASAATPSPPIKSFPIKSP